jgi:transposase-like protein
MYSIDIKNWAVKLYHEKYRTVRRTARALDISKSTIHRWVRQFPPLQRQRQRRFDHERIRAAVLRELQQNPLHTVASLRRAVRDALRENGQPSDYAIRAALQTLRWTRKKVFHRTVPGGGHREKQATFLRDVDGLHDWISVDETSIALDMAPPLRL